MSNTTYSIWQPVRPDFDDYGRADDDLNAIPRTRVYRGTIGVHVRYTERILEALFEQFNIAHPADFRGHSLSVNDVVVIDDRHAYRCASRGWEPCPMPHPSVDGVVHRQRFAARKATEARESGRGLDQRFARMAAQSARRAYAQYAEAVAS